MTFLLEGDGVTLSPPMIFGGDENQDGQIEAEDLNDVCNMASAFSFGYLKEDVYGDGTVEANDLNLTGNNAASFIIIKTP